MKSKNAKTTIFKEKILNNQFVVYTIIVFIISLTMFSLAKISFILKPLLIFIETVALPILLAGVCFYLFNPLIDFLERRGIARMISILALYILIIDIIALIVTSVIPLLREQIQSLISNLPQLSHDIQSMIHQLTQSKIADKAGDALNGDISKITKDLTGYISRYAASLSKGIMNVVGTVTEVVLSIAVLPFLLFYLLKDGKRLPDYIVMHLPNKIRHEAREILRDMNHAVSAYIRGQIFVAVCVGMLLFIGYSMIGLNYALLLAVIAMVTNVVPYLGPIIAISPAIIIAIVTSPFMILKLAVVWVVVQLLEGKVISPQIMGKSLHIHPITVIFVILTAGNLFGIGGLILAVPGYAVLKVIAVHLYRFIRLHSDMYTDTKD
ncbi:putative PurR-regulated permease PerM [Scopulibacillus daqui]|uniref:PurR-regulated permease PerM n=1 Tax=Scopulibacillus daqui TaxID=1469162 RepID=A0ABS2Q288_9BACL|nr:AI-2E family transporter [Scopulibacillus daqui]MBM7646397.1 putative PurR-regulated permease PerM [Scopulibacillus daqui]